MISSSSEKLNTIYMHQFIYIFSSLWSGALNPIANLTSFLGSLVGIADFTGPEQTPVPPQPPYTHNLQLVFFHSNKWHYHTFICLN